MRGRVGRGGAGRGGAGRGGCGVQLWRGGAVAGSNVRGAGQVRGLTLIRGVREGAIRQTRAGL